MSSFFVASAYAQSWCVQPYSQSYADRKIIPIFKSFLVPRRLCRNKGVQLLGGLGCSRRGHSSGDYWPCIAPDAQAPCFILYSPATGSHATLCLSGTPGHGLPHIALGFTQSPALREGENGERESLEIPAASPVKVLGEAGTR